MPLTVKTKPGLMEAGNSYQTLTEFMTALTERNADEGVQEVPATAALIEAATYIDGTYSFPAALDTVPEPLKLVSTLLAQQALKGPLEPMDQSQRVRKRDQSVEGAVKDVTEYFEPSSIREGRVYPLVDRIMIQLGATRQGQGPVGALVFASGGDYAGQV